MPPQTENTLKNPPPADVVALRERVQRMLGLGITAAQDWCASAVHTQRRPWQQWERSECRMHAAFYELACIKIERLAASQRTHHE